MLTKVNANRPEVSVVASADGELIRVHMWTEPFHQGLNTTAHLSVSEAERLISRVREAIDKRPRVASAADLGIAA
jgi:hypothetical protein